MLWFLKRLLCVIGIHFHSRRERYLAGYGNGTFDNPSHYWRDDALRRVSDNADPLDYSWGGLAIANLVDRCPVCGHRRKV